MLRHRSTPFFLPALLVLLVFALLAGVSVQAQTVTFTPELERGFETVVPRFTWATEPAATSCTASGDPAWTGTKAASGSEALAAINVSKTYRIDCTWPGDTSAELDWTRPLTYTNGAPLVIAKYTIAFSTSATDVLMQPLPAGVQVRDLNVPAAQSVNVTGINTPGNYFFCVRVYDAAGNASDCGKMVDGTYPAKTITGGATVTRSISITVDPKPSAVSGITIR